MDICILGWTELLESTFPDGYMYCRVDRAQENLHFLMDICESTLYILEMEETIEVHKFSILEHSIFFMVMTTYLLFYKFIVYCSVKFNVVVFLWINGYLSQMSETVTDFICYTFVMIN